MAGKGQLDRRVERRVPTTRTAVACAQVEAPLKVFDLSAYGVGIEGALLETGHELEFQLSHPFIEEPIVLRGEVRWCRPGPAGNEAAARCGLQFLVVSAQQRRSLRRFLAAEVGGCVRDGPTLIGFAVPHGGGVWYLLDADATKLAVVSREGDGFVLTRRAGPEGPAAVEAPSLAQAAAQAFGVERPKLVGLVLPSASARPRPSPQPPTPATALPRPRPRPDESQSGVSFAGSCVLAGDEVRGYVALTGHETWSLYDPDVRQIAVLARAGLGYTIYWLSDAPGESLRFMGVDSFPAALAEVFRTEGAPQLASATITPTVRPQEAPVPTIPAEVQGSPVVFQRRLVGHLCESGVEDSYIVYDRDLRRRAFVAPDPVAAGGFRACIIGESDEDSMQYTKRHDLPGAVAVALGLPLPPEDPEARPFQLGAVLTIPAAGQARADPLPEPEEAGDAAGEAVAVTLKGYEAGAKSEDPRPAPRSLEAPPPAAQPAPAARPSAETPPASKARAAATLALGAAAVALGGAALYMVSELLKAFQD